MFIAELVLWGIRWGVANQTCGWKQNQERLISCFMFQHISLSYQGWSIAEVTRRLFSPSVDFCIFVYNMQWAAWRNHNWQWHQHQISSAPAQHQQHGVALIVELRRPAQSPPSNTSSPALEGASSCHHVQCINIHYRKCWLTKSTLWTILSVDAGSYKDTATE